MSLFNTLRIGASGLGSSSLSLSVIGDNISNLNTIGYKRSQVSFADALPQAIATLGGTAQLGMGARTGTMATAFGQGAITQSGIGTHMAINGRGWFQVSDGVDNLYTRDGAFTLDQDGFLVSPQGLRLQGFNANGNGDLSPMMGDVQLDQRILDGSPTSLVDIKANLSADAEPGTSLEGLRATGMDGSGAVTLDDIAGSSSIYTTSVTVYDSMGRAQDVVVAFEKTDATSNEWTYSVLVDGGATEVSGALGADGSALEIESGTLTFDGDGNLTSSVPDATAPAWRFAGALDSDIQFDFGQNPDGLGELRQEGGESATFSIGQNGFGTGELHNTRIDIDGKIYGVYSNGEEQLIGQVALATFDAENALERLGGNLFQQTMASGDPAVGTPAAGSLGELQSYALERSNVELESEFVDMIQAQKTYQANSSVVRSANDTLSSLVNLL